MNRGLPHHLSDGDLLHLIERNLILPAIVELGGARGGMVGERLRMLKQPFIFEIGGDAGCAKGA